MQTPADKRYLQLHDGHSTYLVPGERRFVTPEAIQATTLVGSPEEICARVRAAERAGLRELTVLPPSDTSREMLKEFSELVMQRY
jgi:alkanesulfonate monooxygenase SsuD/methylene tetrahydromethanopterin reductase-like flavin-dependent oxidoreductase (luciferase family)